MNCPRCKTDLKNIVYEGVNIDTCESCEGEWLDAGEISDIIKAKEVVFSSDAIEKVEGVKKSIEVLESEPNDRLMCPKCSIPMKRLNYSYSTGVIIDRCSTCSGIWLDKDELEHVQIIMEETEKKLPELKEKFSSVLDEVKKNAEENKKQEMQENLGKGAKSPILRAVYKFLVCNI